MLDGIASLTAGYLFVINNYLPMYICLTFLVISTILSFAFKDIYDVRTKKKDNLKATAMQYIKDLGKTIRFIFKSNRMRAYMFFKIVLYSLICTIEIYRCELLVSIGISEEQYSMIFAVLILMAGMFISQRESIEQKYKNRTLTYISLNYVLSIIIIGIVSSFGMSNNIIIPIILIFFVIQKRATSIWYVLEGKYLKNFTRENDRSKIEFSYQFIGSLVASVSTISASFLLKRVTIQKAYLIVGLVGLFFLVLCLDYMRTRFGLKPEEYKKEDLYIE